VVLAVLKPWAWATPAASPRVVPPPRPIVTAPPPSPATAPGPEALATSVCLGTDAWRIASVETWRLVLAGTLQTQQVRVWRAITPVVAAQGPLDRSIPTVVVAGTEVDELGWCAPGTGSTAPRGPVQVSAWRISPDGSTATPIALRRIAPSAGDTPFAALYREVTDCLASYGCSGSGVPLLASTWEGGAYVFRYQSADGRTWWFGADVQVLPEPTLPPELPPGAIHRQP